MRRMDWRHFLPIKVNISEILQFLFFLAQLGDKNSDFKEKTSYENGDVCRRYKSSVKSSKYDQTTSCDIFDFIGHDTCNITAISPPFCHNSKSCKNSQILSTPD